MDKNEVKNHPQPYISLKQLIKDGCSLNQTQLEKELEWAEQEARKNPQPPPSGGFEDILVKLEERGITPKVSADFEKECQEMFERGDFQEIRGILESKSETENLTFQEESFKVKENKGKERGAKKKSFLYLLRGVGTVAACFAAALAIFLLKPGIDVVGRRDYQYQSQIRNEEKGDIIWNNQENYITELSHLEEAYQEIKDKLGIAVLKLNYVPENIVLSNVFIEDRHARLEFVRQDNFLYVLEVIYPVDDSANRFSDRVNYKKVYNEWMGKWVFIQRNPLKDGLVEYNAYFEHENAYYYLQGIIEEDEFIHIVENLTLETN